MGLDLGDADEEVLRGGVLVAEAAGLLLGPLDAALGACRAKECCE